MSRKEKKETHQIGYQISFRMKARIGDVVLLKKPINGKRDRAVVCDIEAHWHKGRPVTAPPLVIYRVYLERTTSNGVLICKNCGEEDFDIQMGNILDEGWRVLPPWEGCLL